MTVNILLVNKNEDFIISESFDTNFSRLLIFCLTVKAFQKWMKSRSNLIITFIPFIFKFMNSIIYCNSLKILKQLNFEKEIINTHSQFWKFYFIKVDIILDDDKEFDSNFKKLNLSKTFYFLSKFYLKCPPSEIICQSFQKIF